MRSDEELILTAEEYERGFIDFDAILPHDCEVGDARERLKKVNVPYKSGGN
jgi:hypothetical protein